MNTPQPPQGQQGHPGYPGMSPGQPGQPGQPGYPGMSPGQPAPHGQPGPGQPAQPGPAQPFGPPGPPPPPGTQPGPPQAGPQQAGAQLPPGAQPAPGAQLPPGAPAPPPNAPGGPEAGRVVAIVLGALALLFPAYSVIINVRLLALYGPPEPNVQLALAYLELAVSVASAVAGVVLLLRRRRLALWAYLVYGLVQVESVVHQAVLEFLRVGASFWTAWLRSPIWLLLAFTPILLAGLVFLPIVRRTLTRPARPQDGQFGGAAPHMPRGAAGPAAAHRYTAGRNSTGRCRTSRPRPARRGRADHRGRQAGTTDRRTAPEPAATFSAARSGC
ncbi:hypothetical protein [Salinifilum ghardaiensis]